MSVNHVTSSSAAQLAQNLASEIDANKDGQISTSEFGNFILNVLEGASSSSTSTSATSAFRSAMTASNTATPTGTPTGIDIKNIWAASSLGYNPTFLGFDTSRAGAPTTFNSAAGSLKYDAYNVLKNFDPRDPTAMKQAYNILNQLHPGAYELDSEDNLMLTGTADGYIGARPLNRDSDWNNRNQDWCWQWMGYNAAHPGPNGEV